MKKLLFRLILAAGVAAGAWFGYQYFQSLPQRQLQVATTRVRRGDVVVRTFARGELRAVRSVTLAAPNLFGTVQVTRMAALGSLAREKDLVVEFDDSELLSRLEEKQLELDQVDEQIKKAKADLAIRNNQDQVELLRARYSVRRSELEVKRNELLSEIDAKRNLLNLEESRRRLKQLESDIKSRLEQAEAELAVLQERRNRAVLELNRERQRLMQVKLLSPITGLVAVRQNRSSGFFVPGMQIPDIREGDQVQPGIPVVDILDLSELEVISRVGELDRANLREGQDVILRLDAIPETRLHGSIKSMSGTASASVFANDPQKKFDVVFSIDMRQLLTSLGASKEQIAKIMATAEANRKKPIAASSMSGMGGMGGMGGMMAMMGGGGPPGMGGMPGGMASGMMGGGGAGGGGPRMLTFGGGPGGQGGPGGGGGGAFGGISDEMRTKMREVFQRASGGKSPGEMTEEERAEFQKKMQAEMAKLGFNAPQGIPFGGRRQAGEGGPASGGRREGEAGQQGQGREGRRAEGGGRGQGGPAGAGDPGGPGGPGGRRGGPRLELANLGMPATQFTQKELDEAKLPPAPEEDDQLDVLLRPGMLADVEIIVEKIPNALHVPNQAVFERSGKAFVFIRTPERFEERPVTIARRTESTVVLSSGVNAGDVVAMADPFARPGDKKAKESKGGAMGALPVGGGQK